MKKLLLLGLAVLGLFACTPSANPIPEDPKQDPTENPTPNPNDDPKIDTTKFSFNAGNAFAAPRKGGVVEIPVEFEGEYTISSNASFVQVVRTKAMQKGTVAVSVSPNLEQSDRSGVLTIRYVSKQTTTTYPNGQQPTTEKKYAEKQVQITQQPVANEVLFADITKANTLYVAASSSPSGAASKAATSAHKLYKIAATGAVDSVVFKDEYGDTATVAIQYIRNLSDKYVFMNLRIEPRNQDKYYVVRKTDGAVFAAKPPYIDNNTQIQVDYRQNVYFMNNSGLYKMYDYGGGVDIAQLTKSYMSMSTFLVDQRGNVLLHYRNTTTGVEEKLCYTASGEFSKADWNHRGMTFILKGEPEGFYFISYLSGYASEAYNGTPGYEDTFKLSKLNCTPPVSTSDVLASPMKFNGTVVRFGQLTIPNVGSAGPTVVLDNMTLLSVNIGGGNSTAALLRIETGGGYKLVPLSRSQWPKIAQYKLKASGDYLYGYNSDEIYRININNGQVETLYGSAEYSIYDYSLSSDGVITFSALELRKAQDVVCELRNGQIKVLKADDSQKIIQLERIN